MITFTGPGCHPRLWPHFLHIFLLGLMKTFTRLLWHVKGFRLFVCLFVICFYLCLVLHNTMWKSSINSANWCNLSQRLRPQWFRDWSCHLRISANKIKLADTAIWHPYCCPADKRHNERTVLLFPKPTMCWSSRRGRVCFGLHGFVAHPSVVPWPNGLFGPLAYFNQTKTKWIWCRRIIVSISR